VGDALGVVLWAARVSFLFDDGGRYGGRSVDRDVYPLRAFLGSACNRLLGGGGN